jgi:hypothetical protein
LQNRIAHVNPFVPASAALLSHPTTARRGRRM